MKKISRHQKLVATCIAIFFVALLGIYLWAQSANDAKITNGTGSVQTAINLKPKTLNDPYFRFTYLGIYHIGSQIPQPPELANYMLTASTSYEKNISVHLVNGEMSNLSAYIFRQTRTDLYSSQTIPISGGVATVWTKLDKSEVTAFMPHESMVATISLSVQNSNVTDGLSEEMANLLSSFRWQ